MSSLSRFFVLGLLFFCPLALSAQTGCGCSQCDIPIIADHSRSFSLDVYGAQSNLLGVNGQGVCEVEIDFAHDFIADLKMSLTSPNGITVQLVAVPSLQDTSYFSRWKIKFKRCLDAAIPDPGFAPNFDANTNWPSSTIFTGSYYPAASNCLESFNTGSVNGQWMLNVTSNGFRGVGFIYGFKIRFCKEAGIFCNGLNYSTDAGENCDSAVPLPPDIDLYVGNTAPYAPGFAPGFCGTIENDQWFSFVSNCSEIEFTITAGYCLIGNGVQIALYENCNTGPIACSVGCNNCSWQSWTVTAATIPGQTYYILIDGFAGDQCDFEFTIPPGCVGGLGDPDPYDFSPYGCEGSTLDIGLTQIPFGAAGYIWKATNGALINGQTQVTIPGPGNTDVELTFGNGAGQVCVAAYNFTDTSDFVCFNYTADTTLYLVENATICYTDIPFFSAYEAYGVPPLYTPGTYNFLLQDYIGANGQLYPCPVHLKINLQVEGSFSQLPAVIALGDQYVLPNGDIVSDSGFFPWSDTLASGCTNDHVQGVYLVDYVQNGDGCAPDTVSFILPGSVILECPGGIPSVIGGSGIKKVVYQNSGVYDLIGKIGTQSFLFEDTLKLSLAPAPIASFTHVLIQNVLTVNNLSQNATGYLWNFGDGATSSEVNPVHEYTAPGVYTVTLTAFGDCPANTRTIVLVIGGQLPQANFQVSEQSGCSPFVVQYTNQSIGDPFSFEWQFPGGDPSSSTLENPVVTYLLPGTYDATLTIQNVFGQSTSVQNAVITVTPLPEALFVFTLLQNQIVLENNSTNASSYFWDFGDGFSSTEFEPTHTYSAPGDYTITLIATGACGESAATLYVKISGLAPLANFQALPSLGCRPLIVQYQDQSPNNPTAWLWQFPGGTPPTSTEQNPSVIYFDSGVFDASLTALNAFGESTSTQSGLIQVNPLPAAQFTISVNGLELSFENQSQNADTYSWDFGDGATSTESSPSHVYAAPGTYLVTLVATNICGSSILQQWVTVMASGAVSPEELGWIRVLPNPSNGHFQLEVRDEPSTQLSWRLYNTLGQALAGHESGAFDGHSVEEVDLAQMPPAVYWLEVRTLEKRSWLRLVFQ